MSHGFAPTIDDLPMTATFAAQEPVSVGIVGCGFVTLRHHLPAIAAIPGARVVALADCDAGALERAGEMASRAVLHARAAALLEDARVEAVAICTPVGSHAELTLAALSAGRHVLVEKPLAADLAEADALVEAAARGGLVAGVGFKYRRHRLVAMAVEIVRSGELGPLRLVETAFTSDSRRNALRANGWRGDRARGGGSILEQAVHHFDLWRLLTGSEVTRVTALASGGDAASAISAEMEDGVIASTIACDDAGLNHDVRIHGRDGTLTVRLDRFDGVEVVPAGALPGDVPRRIARGVRLARSLPAMARSHRAGGDITAADAAQWQAFAEAVRGGAPFEPGLADGRAALAVALAAIESAETAMVVRPSREATLAVVA